MKDLAIEALLKMRQKIAFDANLARALGPGAYLLGDRRLKEYNAINDRIALLSKPDREGGVQNGGEA